MITTAKPFLGLIALAFLLSPLSGTHEHMPKGTCGEPRHVSNMEGVNKPEQTDIVVVKPKNLRERQKWTSSTFFDSIQALDAAKAVEAKDNLLLASLIKMDLDVNLQGKSGMTLLHWSYVNDNLEAFELLLDSGASPDLRLTGNIPVKVIPDFQAMDSVLFTIARTAPIGLTDMKFFDAALQKTSDIELKDKDGRTLLLLCADPTRSNFCDEDIIAKITKRGADRNARTSTGYTAAMISASMSYPMVAVRLLEEGADPSFVDSTGHSVLTMLRRLSSPDTNRLFNSYSASDRERILKWVK